MAAGCLGFLLVWSKWTTPDAVATSSTSANEAARSVDFSSPRELAHLLVIAEGMVDKPMQQVAVRVEWSDPSCDAPVTGISRLVRYL